MLLEFEYNSHGYSETYHYDEYNKRPSDDVVEAHATVYIELE